MFDFIQIIILLFFCSAILFLISNAKIRTVISIILSTFFSLECCSLYYGGSLIDYKFYQHSNFNDVSKSISFFWKEAIFLVLFTIIIFLLFKFIYTKFNTKIKKTYVIVIAIITFILLNISDSVFNNIYKIFKLNNVTEVTLDNALSKLNIDEKDYVYSKDIKAEKGKNIVVISLESYERGFLEDDLKKLTPNLNAFKNKYSYFNMNQGDGSEWTTGSMYTYLTGTPMFFKGQGNAIFQNAIASKITGISHVLDKAGYNQLYLIGNPEFSGVNDLLKTYGINHFEQSYYDQKYGDQSFGIHDFDLFSEAKEQVLDLNNKNAPFALYLSTISTHLPNGRYDERMEKHVSKKESDFEFMVASVDFMIQDFIKFLDTKGILENTTFYIFPDHLIMGNSINVLDKMDKENRSLFLLTNANRDNLSAIEANQPIEQIDLPRIILDGAEIKHNAKFLTDYIKGNKKAFIENNKKKILALNQASISINGFNKDFKISLEDFKDSLTVNTIKIKTNDNSLQFESDSLSINDYRYHAFVFDEHMRVIHYKRKNDKVFSNHLDGRVNILLDIKDVNHINVFLRKGGLISKAKKNYTSEIEILKEDLDNLKLLGEYDFKNETIAENKYFKLNNTEGTFYVTSASNLSSVSSVPSSIVLNGRKLKISKGLNVIQLHNPSWTITYSVDNGNINKLSKIIKKLKQEKRQFIIVADNVEDIESAELRSELKELGLNKLNYIHKGYSYISYYENGIFVEQMDDETLFSQINIKQDDKHKKEINTIKKDPSRFIAHAGGAVDGKTYTNSLEALNYNYSRGFRYFELDFIKTVDNHFVAAHDWGKWKKDNFFKPEDSISLETFMSVKNKGKYTPLSMVEINAWFKNHKDAILVTDKVNTPKEFADAFVDKNRLMMELFSKKAIIEANNNNIKCIAAPRIFKGLSINQKIQLIEDNNIKYISVSRKSIISNKTYYTTLKELGVKIYAYHISFEKWKDENYTLLNEMEFIYGIYADNWNFNE
ncbi:sulfatase-like hydrolase/transferase [Lacinutrix sp. WUR7]|uniref:sulfatase-like hydrolase/transferase n=1 Tax=Lacinutrix sp. WUR7 TaxID=2653681 RepID=UPI00193D809F|nr:sulfatase-like hydrolase/transferase [Lacinutrix sp. WUR7]QRM87842.1 sulfatase-like hydrolase/transferase [Lacinutrix sp. WUR7]